MRGDRRCGTEFPLPDGSPSECDPNSINPCKYTFEYVNACLILTFDSKAAQNGATVDLALTTVAAQDARIFAAPIKNWLTSWAKSERIGDVAPISPYRMAAHPNVTENPKTIVVPNGATVEATPSIATVRHASTTNC